MAEMTTSTTQASDPSATTRGGHVRPVEQSGILNRPPQCLLLAALELTGNNPRQTVEELRGILKDELTSEMDALGGADAPPVETGELGWEAHHDRAHLTVTVGFSNAGYAKLGVASGLPGDLVDVPWTALGDNPPAVGSGDMILQICADNAYIVEHVLRRIEHRLTAEVVVVWAHTGEQRYNSRPGRTSRREGRAWIGFLDGVSNLDPRHNPGDYALTFVDPSAVSSYPAIPVIDPNNNPYGPDTNPVLPNDLRKPPSQEPPWTIKGSYLVARVSVTPLASWDAQTLCSQQQAVGRYKQSGASLDLAADSDAAAQPAFASDQSNLSVALNAHIRKANPRRNADDAQRRIFRRGYPLYEGGAEGLRRGLIFLAYGRTISTQFEFITRAWLTNPNFPQSSPATGSDLLRQFDGDVLAGGYYFVPPLDHASQPWSWHVPDAG